MVNGMQSGGAAENPVEVRYRSLSPTREQRRRINRQMGNLRARNHAVRWGDAHMSPETFQTLRYGDLLERCLFLEKTDFRAETAFLSGLDVLLTNLEKGEPLPFPAYAAEGSPEASRYVTWISREDVQVSSSGLGTVSLPCVGAVEAAFSPAFSLPKTRVLPVCVRRESDGDSLVFLTEEMRGAYWKQARERTRREQAAAIANVRKRIGPLERELARKQTDPAMGKLPRTGMRTREALEQKRRHLQNMRMHNANQAWSARRKEAAGT